MIRVTNASCMLRRKYIRGVVSVERVVSRALQVGWHSATEQDTIYLVVDVARPIPEVENELVGTLKN